MASKVESESYIPVGTIYFEEREDGLLHEKEMLKRTMLQHEITFKNQVHELHRLYRVQRDLMQEYQRNNNNNNSQTNSISQNEISIFESNHINNNNNINNNFEFIREGSAQSSSKNAVNENGKNVSIFGKRVSDENGNISLSGKHVVDLNKDEKVSIFGKRVSGSDENENLSNFGKRVVDLNEDANVCDVSNSGKMNEGVVNGSGLDFMGVNKRVSFDQGSGSVSGKVGLDKIFHDREKGESSAVINNFFTSQINPQPPNNNNNNNINNHSNINSNNNPFPISSNNNNNNNCNNFYMNYKPALPSFIFPNQFSISPHLYPQSLTINFDPSQINNNNNNNNENNPNNNNNNNNNSISYPVLDSSPHYINLDKSKNKSPIPGFIHTIPVPVFNNGSFKTGTSENSSFYFNNLSKNSTHSIQGSLSLPWIQNSKLNCERNLNLNEPVQEGTTQNVNNNNNNNNNNNFNVNNNKGVIIFGANCKGNNENNKSVTGGVHSSSNLTKLLGFPVFSNPNSSETKPLIEKPVCLVPELESCNNKRTINIIDLNEAYSPLENNNNNNNDNHPSNEINKGKKAIINFDLNDDLSCENDSLAIDAANNILLLSNALRTAHEPGSDNLSWFADIAVAAHSDPVPEPESDTDSYEEMVLNLKPVIKEDRFGADKYIPKNDLGQSSDQTGYGSLLFSKGKRGPARKRRQKRDFQRDVLPTLASLSRVEVTEDLHLIGGLVRASGQEFDVALTRRVGRSGSNRRQRGPQVMNQAGRSDPPQRSAPVVNQPGRCDLPQRSVPFGSQTGRSDPPQVSLPQMNPMVQRQVNVNLPPRFPVPQMVNLVHMNQLQVNMNMVHVDREQQHRRLQETQQQNGNNIVIGWERFTRRARRPRGPPAQQHHHHMQGIINNNHNNGNNNNGGADLHNGR